jgi:hypothetical protein
MSPRIESDTLNVIFQKWLIQNYPNQDKGSTRSYFYHIDRVNLKYGEGKEFDLFVWQNGGIIRREDRHRYAEFFEDSNLTAFLLRWS